MGKIVRSLVESVASGIPVIVSISLMLHLIFPILISREIMLKLKK